MLYKDRQFVNQRTLISIYHTIFDSHLNYASIVWGQTKSSINRVSTTTTSVLMPLSRLAEVGNFCFNVLSPFHWIVRILPSQAISFQIFLYALFPRFPWSILLSFHWYFMLHDLMYLGADISTNDMTIPPQTSLNYKIFDCHNNTHLIPKNISQHPINQPHSTHHLDHTMLHPTQPHFIHNSKFPHFTTVQ